MILYYGVDREILNARGTFELSNSSIEKIEQEIESELRYIIFIMPLEERIIISPTFLFESEMCRKIIGRNREFVDNGYLLQYMKESSNRDFWEKKAERYKKAMEICLDYKEAYDNISIYKEVNKIWMPKVEKKESVGIDSRLIFCKSIQKTGKKEGIPDSIIERILKIINDISDDVFLWEVVQNALIVRGITSSIIRKLSIRQEMNNSYLNVFGNHSVQIPYNSIISDGIIGYDSIYDIWKIKCILHTLGILFYVNLMSAGELIKIRNNIDMQEVLQIIREGLSQKKAVETICKSVQEKTDIKLLIQKILKNGGENEMIICEKIQESTLKLLHLSDLHMIDQKSMERSLFFLRLDLKKQLKIHKLDYLVISGDVSDRPIAGYYETALLFCQKLINEFELDIKKVIIVPGNHDCDREASKKAYDSSTNTFCEDIRKMRYQAYNDYFYKPLFSKDYSLEYEHQIDHIKDDEHKIFITGFNSSFQIDHIETKKSGICMEAIQNDTDVFDLDNDYIKLVTWHHPISGFGSIEDKTFLESLAILGYKVCLHGHIHEAVKENYLYDDNYNIKMIGAGTFGALQKERGDGIPLQYNLIEIDSEKKQLIVHTRKREKENGIWMADARWGDKVQVPKSYYTINLNTYEM